MKQAWEIYFTLYQRLQNRVQHAEQYELKNVAPKLMASENLEILMPGTYKCGEKIVSI